MRDGDDLADGVGYGGPQQHRAGHVEHGREHHGLARGGAPGGDQGGYRIGGVVEAVGQGESHGEADGDDQPDFHELSRQDVAEPTVYAG